MTYSYKECIIYAIEFIQKRIVVSVNELKKEKAKIRKIPPLKVDAESKVNLFFSDLRYYTAEPEVPYQYIHSVLETGHFENINKTLKLMCLWSAENLEYKWYIRESSLIIDVWKETISFEFNFVSATDLIAFKLRWN